MAAILNICSTLIYVLAPVKPAIYLASIIEAVGYAFLFGAGEALMHDSLAVQNKLSGYTKLLSRTQSASLIINAGLMALVPMTYAIDKRLPFLIGTLAYVSLFIATLFMKEVGVTTKSTKHLASFRELSKEKGILLFALVFGIIGSLYLAPSDMNNLALKYLGVNPALLGWIFAAGSILGAIAGLFFHHVKRIRLTSYLILDVTLLILPFIAIFLQSLPFLVVSFMMSISFWRYRRIYYQDLVLAKYPTHPKATLLSILNNSESIQTIWLPAAIGITVARFGIINSYGILTMFSLIVAVFFVIIAKQFFSAKG